MNKKKIHICVLILVSIILGVGAFTYNNRGQVQKPAVEKSYDKDKGLTLLSYNGQTYYELDSLSHYKAQNGISIPDSINDFEPYELRCAEQVDLKSYLNELSGEQGIHYYMQKDHYFIYDTDSWEHPAIIFEVNKTAAGPSDGWYYFVENFDFTMPTVTTGEIHTVLLMDNEFNVVWTIQNQDVIHDLIDMFYRKEDVREFLYGQTKENWSFLYVCYMGTPFIQRICNNVEMFEYVN